jgi:CheY-like chemotaxis protein
MLTPANRPADVARALAAGAVTTLLKPVKPSKLARAIMTAVLGADRPLPLSVAGDTATDAGPDEPPLRQLRVLLAEDNEVNQKFAVRVLEHGKHTVVVVNNGRQAVDEVSANSFDLILMDVQMPEMDGLSACREIRERERHRDRRTPIIALTANASAEDRAKCLAAGMDGYVTKPVRSALLLAEMRRLLAETQPTAEDPGLTSLEALIPLSNQEYTPANEVFDSATFLTQNDGNLEFLAEARDILSEESPRLQQAIREAVSRNDAAAVAAAAHTVKGMVGNFHARAAATAAANLESLGRGGTLTGVDQAIVRLETELGRLESALGSYLAAARVSKES